MPNLIKLVVSYHCLANTSVLEKAFPRVVGIAMGSFRSLVSLTRPKAFLVFVGIAVGRFRSVVIV